MKFFGTLCLASYDDSPHRATFVEAVTENLAEDVPLDKHYRKVELLDVILKLVRKGKEQPAPSFVTFYRALATSFNQTGTIGSKRKSILNFFAQNAKLQFEALSSVMF